MEVGPALGDQNGGEETGWRHPAHRWVRLLDSSLAACDCWDWRRTEMCGELLRKLSGERRIWALVYDGRSRRSARCLRFRVAHVTLM